MREIQMVDLRSQYHEIKGDIDKAIIQVIEDSAFINGAKVKEFCQNLSNYLNVKHVIPCANGTDALQIALMALDLPQGSEIITPSFSYAALAEAIHLLKLKPVFIEVDESTFNIDVNAIEAAITDKTKAIAPVHLYGQCANVEPILEIAKKFDLYVIEDTAQAIGAFYTFENNTKYRAGCMGHIGTTSFFPSKNLGCFGDGGALFTNDEYLAEKLRMIVNHGQKIKYQHEIIGVNSRLDTMQAAILDIKLKRLDEYTEARNFVADYYDNAFANNDKIITPYKSSNSTHVYHQYTIKLKGVDRNKLMNNLKQLGIPTMIYYPTPLHQQNAYKQDISLPITEKLSKCVLSLPISTEMDETQLKFITEKINILTI